MRAIEVEAAVLIDDRDCAFAKAVEIPDGRLLCSYGVGGGPEVWGGTDWSVSDDGGRTWRLGGTIVPRREEAGGVVVSNALKLSQSATSSRLFAYGSRFYRTAGATFGSGRDEAILCTSDDRGGTWSAPRVLPFDCDHPLEISDSLLSTPGGRILAPAGLLPAEDRLGERVLGLLSEDDGETWPRRTVIFEHPAHKHGYFEHKFTVLPNGDLLGISWTVTLDRALADQPNHAVRSVDDGATWSRPLSTGIQGQTMSALAVDDETLLLAYNRRYGVQGIVLAWVRITAEPWSLLAETTGYHAQARLETGEAGEGVATFDAFRFGFPQLLRLADGTVLLTYWAMPAGAKRYGVYASRVSLSQ